MLPIGTWWDLRKKFKQSIPGVVTDSYLATIFNIQANSARANILPALKQLGIIDEEGKTGEKAKQWRDDEHYAAVCKEMLGEVYPKELLDVAPDPAQDRSAAERWFANQTGAGQAAVGKMAAVYAVLVAADASKQPDQEKKERPRKAEKQPRSKPERTPVTTVHPGQAATPAAHISKGDSSHREDRPVPGININLQIHISADATPDQIDQIFASMAKHIYNRG